MKIAVIDMGTNTFHLMISDVEKEEHKVLYTEKKSVKIGKGGINDKRITEEAQQRAIDTLLYFKEKIDRHGVEEVFATATSAIRSAKNGQALVDKIKSLTGIEVTIISGDQEAQYIYDAVKFAVSIGDETSLIMDIGGGSVEFIICNEHEIFWKKSYEIGAQRLLELFHYHDPIFQEEIENLNLFLTEKLADLIYACLEFKPTILIGSSGSFDTFSDMYCIQADKDKTINKDAESPLPFEYFPLIYDQIISKNKAQRMLIPGMVEMRVDMIVVAAILVDFVITNCQLLDKIRVSRYSLKEGVLSNILQNLKDN